MFKSSCSLSEKKFFRKDYDYDYERLRWKKSDQKTNLFPKLSLGYLLGSSSSVKLHAMCLSNFYYAYVHKSSIKKKKPPSLKPIVSPTEKSLHRNHHSSQLEVIYGNLGNNFCEVMYYIKRSKQLKHSEKSFMPLNSEKWSEVKRK